jgi:hypothetical protein
MVIMPMSIYNVQEFVVGLAPLCKGDLADKLNCKFFAPTQRVAVANTAFPPSFLALASD